MLDRYILTFLIFIAITGAAAAQGSKQTDEEQPKVVKAVGPSTYPPIAMAARAEGRIVVEVQISADGRVTEAKGVEGHKLLQKIAELAAEHWQFAPAGQTTKKRIARLMFIFRILPSKGGKEEGATSFLPPLQVEFTKRAPELVNKPSYSVTPK